MKLLLTNDDGVDAAGLGALARVAAAFGQTLVVAPRDHHSGCSHRATTDRRLALSSLDPQRFALDGTPVDCTRIGVAHLAPDVDWVLSGINEGGNLGADVYLSGTVAAAREAALLGKPAIAVSQYRRPNHAIDWSRAARWTKRVLAELLERRIEPRQFWNVNLPDAEQQPAEAEIVFCEVDPHPLPVDFHVEADHYHYRGRYQDRRREPAHDVDVCFSGRIAVSRIELYRPPQRDALAGQR